MTNIDLLSISASLRKCTRTYTLELAKKIKSAFDEHPDFHNDKAQEGELRAKLRTLLGASGGDASRADSACDTFINDHRRHAPAAGSGVAAKVQAVPKTTTPPAGRGRTVVVIKKKDRQAEPAAAAT